MESVEAQEAKYLRKDMVFASELAEPSIDALWSLLLAPYPRHPFEAPLVHKAADVAASTTGIRSPLRFPVAARRKKAASRRRPSTRKRKIKRDSSLARLLATPPRLQRTEQSQDVRRWSRDDEVVQQWQRTWQEYAPLLGLQPAAQSREAAGYPVQPNASPRSPDVTPRRLIWAGCRDASPFSGGRCRSASANVTVRKLFDLPIGATRRTSSVRHSGAPISMGWGGGPANRRLHYGDEVRVATPAARAPAVAWASVAAAAPTVALIPSMSPNVAIASAVAAACAVATNSAGAMRARTPVLRGTSARSHSPSASFESGLTADLARVCVVHHSPQRCAPRHIVQLGAGNGFGGSRAGNSEGSRRNSLNHSIASAPAALAGGTVPLPPSPGQRLWRSQCPPSPQRVVRHVSLQSSPQQSQRSQCPTPQSPPRVVRHVSQSSPQQSQRSPLIVTMQGESMSHPLVQSAGCVSTPVKPVPPSFLERVDWPMMHSEAISRRTPTPVRTRGGSAELFPVGNSLGVVRQPSASSSPAPFRRPPLAVQRQAGSPPPASPSAPPWASHCLAPSIAATLTPRSIVIPRPNAAMRGTVAVTAPPAVQVHPPLRDYSPVVVTPRVVQSPFGSVQGSKFCHEMPR